MLSVGTVLVYSFLDRWAKGEHHKVESRPISLKEIKNFSPLYWIALLIATLIYSTITPLRGQTSFVMMTSRSCCLAFCLSFGVD
jgi:hypothetical protein